MLSRTAKNAVAPTASVVLAARLLDRVGKGVRGAPRDALVADITPARVRARSMRNPGDEPAVILVALTVLVIGPQRSVRLTSARPDNLRGVSAVIAANQWLRDNPKLAAEKIQEWTGINKEVVYIFLGPSGNMTTDPTIKPALIDAAATDVKVLQNLGRMKEFDVEKWVNDSYVRKAYAELGLDYDKQRELLQKGADVIIGAGEQLRAVGRRQGAADAGAQGTQTSGLKRTLLNRVRDKLPKSVCVGTIPPSGYRYVRVASDILLLAVGTNLVVDAIEDLVR